MERLELLKGISFGEGVFGPGLYNDLAAFCAMGEYGHGCPSSGVSLQPNEVATAANSTRHSADFIGILDPRQPQNSLINSTSSCNCSGGPS